MHERPPRPAGLGANDGVDELVRDAFLGAHANARRAIVGVSVGRVLEPRVPVDVSKDKL